MKKQLKHEKGVRSALDVLKALNSTSKDEPSKKKGLEDREETKKKGNKDKGNVGKKEDHSPSLDKVHSLLSKRKQHLEQRLKEQGVDVDSLLSEDSQASIEEHEESLVEKVRKASELERKGKKGLDKRDEELGDLDRKGKKNTRVLQPHRESPTKPHSAPVLPDFDLESMPESKSELNRGVLNYLTRMQYIALHQAEQLLLKSDLKASPSELIKLATSLKDMQLTIRWTKKLEDAILNNPSKMKPPGVGGSFRLLDRVSLYAKEAKKEVNVDGRKSGIKHALNSSQLELPPDVEDQPSKQVEGA